MSEQHVANKKNAAAFSEHIVALLKILFHVCSAFILQDNRQIYPRISYVQRGRKKFI